MSTNPNPNKRSQRHLKVDARVGNALFEVKFGVDALRTIRTSLMQIAYSVGEDPAANGYVVLADSPITMERLREEWERAATVLRKDVLRRLTICLHSEDRMTGIPKDPNAKTQRMLSAVVDAQRGKTKTARTDYSFVVQKILIHSWLTWGEPVTSEWLASTAGCSYPAVARALGSLGSLVERRSDRRVKLRWFPAEEFARLLAVADRARSTARFADHSGQPRSTKSHLQRLEKLRPPDLAIGGVLGAKQYFPDIDLVGTPRLDLSLHSPGKRMNLDFIEQLDPALKRVDDPLAPASVVVHAVRHANALFTPRKGGLVWADPVECLLDLHEARLKMQAAQFLDFLKADAKSQKGAKKIPARNSSSLP